MRKLFPLVALLLTTVLLSSCSNKNSEKKNPPPPANPTKPDTPPVTFSHRLRVMAYNVENLFDTAHDEGKNDWEFLPKDTPGKKEFCETEPPQYKTKCLESDWTDAKLEIKLGQIAKVLEKAAPMPNMLALTEVENEAVVRKLADRLGYKELAITQGPDDRGIDVALLFNETPDLRFLRSRSETVDLKPFGGKPSRDVLIVEFEYGQTARRKLAVLVNHWPSQNNKTVNRRAFADLVRRLTLVYTANGYDVLAAGDFNTELMNDHPSPFMAFEGPSEPTLFDVDRLFRENFYVLKADASQVSPGTYFFWSEGSPSRAPAMTWNLLDRFFLSRTLRDRVDLKSYRIINDPEFTRTITFKRGPLKGTSVAGVPWSYSHQASTPEQSGFSDHFAIVVDIGYN